MTQEAFTEMIYPETVSSPQVHSGEDLLEYCERYTCTNVRMA
jgi:hypothetical protein